MNREFAKIKWALCACFRDGAAKPPQIVPIQKVQTTYCGGLIRLNRTGWYLSFVMNDTPKPDKRWKYDAAFRAVALRLAA